MIQDDLKELRRRFGYPMSRCAAALGCTVEGYRLKETGESPIAGLELAKLADMYGMPLRAAFPSYKPTPGELSLARHLCSAA